MGGVVQMIDRYMKSIHARPSREDQSRTNATCYSCHDAHYVYPAGSDARAEWRLNIPNTCGKCHAKQREEYAKSVHGKAVLEDKNQYAAVCSDCHSTHDVESPAKTSAKLAIVQNCGTCHADSLKTYTGTYHGQVGTLGFAYTAKCYDCHGSHEIKRVADAASTMHPENRLNTCQKCHKDATAGLRHLRAARDARTISRAIRTSGSRRKFMIALLAGVFLFFWSHTALWFYREYRDRQERKSRPHVVTDEPPELKGKQFQRFGAGLARGAPCLRAERDDAGPDRHGRVLRRNRIREGGHRRVRQPEGRGLRAPGRRDDHAGNLLHPPGGRGGRASDRNLRTWNWFGPISMVPSWQDLKDAIAMFKWFFGLGPRPMFDRWTYWEKFDYWAVFWGMAIIGGSGMMLAFPAATASVLPGWLFNVATIIHGEEAILAAVFLFTVHFFNNHFRPDKFPLDTVMFTGAVPLEEFRREHALEYKRLVRSGELSKHLVDVPSEPMMLGSKILGFTPDRVRPDAARVRHERMDQAAADDSPHDDRTNLRPALVLLPAGTRRSTQAQPAKPPAAARNCARSSPRCRTSSRASGSPRSRARAAMAPTASARLRAFRTSPRSARPTSTRSCAPTCRVRARRAP